MRNKKLIVLFSILLFVTLVVVLSSVIFSVQNVYAYCYNTYDDVMDAKVASKEINGIKRGRSIFMLNEKAIIEEVEDKLSDVKVINVERKFPNQVYINYVRIFPYLAVETEDETLYVSNDCKILSKGEKREYYTDAIRLIYSDVPSSKTEGEYVFSLDLPQNALLTALMDTVERMDLRSVVIDMFEFIDISRTASDNLTYIKTRTGTYFELQGDGQNVREQIRIAVSLYLSEETRYMNGGTIIVSMSGKNVYYTKENNYSKL